jgi:hypothetical protein
MVADRWHVLSWRVTDELDYFVTLTRLRILNALAAPEPEMPTDQRRERERRESPRSTVSWSCNLGL